MKNAIVKRAYLALEVYCMRQAQHLYYWMSQAVVAYQLILISNDGVLAECKPIQLLHVSPEIFKTIFHTSHCMLLCKIHVAFLLYTCDISGRAHHMT